MQVAQANFKMNDHILSLPVIIPDIKSIRAFAQARHARGDVWSGTFEGWPATYTPEKRTRRPANSQMTFIPAEFFVGVSENWHVAIAWEDGREEPPIELENRRGIDGKSRVVYLDEFAAEVNSHLLTNGTPLLTRS
ncbi:MAG: hypothetical protein R3E79_53170 [Caldilineaceae bacterium]